MWLKADTHRPLTIVIIALSLLAWLALWLWGQSPYSRFLSHHALETVRGNVALLPLFVAGWVVMTIAMMLPTSLPLITLFQNLICGRRDDRQLVGRLIAGFLVTWTLFGVMVYAGDWLLHQIVHQVEWMHENADKFGALILIAAGIYQFTPLKYYCLDKCRSPMSFIAARWHGRNAGQESLALGFEHGLFCIGCCWSLMRLMFAIGAGNLGWMLGLGTVMAVEKNVSWGRRISRPLGAALLAWGVVSLLLSALPTG